MDLSEDFIDAIEILIDKKMKNIAQIYIGRVISYNSSESSCVISVNGLDQTAQVYGGAPVVNSTYPLFVPSNNMSMAFIIVPSEEE